MKNGPNVPVTNAWKPSRDVLDVKANATGATLHSQYDYAVNRLGQRTGVATSGNAFASGFDWAWDYNFTGELTNADHSLTTAFNRGYQYDGIGNRLRAAAGSTDPADPGATNYTANTLNQYTAVAATTPMHDADGNLLFDGAGQNLGWNGENRFVELRDNSNNVVAAYLYDYQGRRVRKTTTASALQGATDIVYVYDGWNLIAEYEGLPSSLSLHTSFVWGLDLSGSLQGAGGVGGLLGVTQASGTYYPTYDGNGNISEYLSSLGAVAAHYEYDPFGNTIVITGSSTNDFNYRFSTKPQDIETGFYYYGYRHYNPETGRWLSRDPNGERGGYNLARFVGNDALNSIDLNGLKKCVVKEPKVEELALGVDEKVKWNKINNGDKLTVVSIPGVARTRANFSVSASFKKDDCECCSVRQEVRTEPNGDFVEDTDREGWSYGHRDRDAQTDSPFKGKYFDAYYDVDDKGNGFLINLTDLITNRLIRPTQTRVEHGVFGLKLSTHVIRTKESTRKHSQSSGKSRMWFYTLFGVFVIGAQLQAASPSALPARIGAKSVTVKVVQTTMTETRFEIEIEVRNESKDAVNMWNLEGDPGRECVSVVLVDPEGAAIRVYRRGNEEFHGKVSITRLGPGRATRWVFDLTDGSWHIPTYIGDGSADRLRVEIDQPRMWGRKGFWFGSTVSKNIELKQSIKRIWGGLALPYLE